MPTATVGLDKTLKALREFSPDLYKELTKEITKGLKEVVASSKADVPDKIVGLSSWQKQSSRETGRRQFPRFNPVEAKRGIGYSIGKQKTNKNGWAGRYVVFNSSPSGMVMETAGRVNREGNPDKRNSAHFINAINSRLPMFNLQNGKEGRIIYKEVSKRQNRLKSLTINSINQAVSKANQRIANGN